MFSNPPKKEWKGGERGGCGYRCGCHCKTKHTSQSYCWCQYKTKVREKKEPIEKKVEESKVPQNEIPVEGGKGLKDMPQAVVLRILGSMTGTTDDKVRDFANFDQTNKEYHELASDPMLWKQSFKQKTQPEMKKIFEEIKEELRSRKKEYESVKKEFLNQPLHDKYFFKNALQYEMIQRRDRNTLIIFYLFCMNHSILSANTVTYFPQQLLSIS